MCLTKFITRIVSPEELNKPIPSGMKYQPIYSLLSEKETYEVVAKTVSNLIMDYGMEPVAPYKEGKHAKKYELKYHFMILKIYIAKSEFYKMNGCVRVHFEVKYDIQKSYNNSVDNLVWNEVFTMYDELFNKLIYV